jgi:hypothetical protein
MGGNHMWKRKLPSLQKLNRLKIETQENVVPLIVAMPKSSRLQGRWFVITEFKSEVLVEVFTSKKDAQNYASAIYETLQAI